MFDLGGKRVLITGAAERLGAAIARTFAECGAAVVVHCFRSKAAADALAASLREVEAPVLLIWGEDDKWHHVESSNLYRSALPNAALTVVRNAGHLVHEEKPDRIYELVRSFIPAGYGIDD